MRFPRRLGLPAVMLLTASLFAVLLAAAVPDVGDRIIWHWNDLRARIFYSVNPPEEKVFIPSTPSMSREPTVTATMRLDQAPVPTDTPAINMTAAPEPSATMVAPEPTQLPRSAMLANVPYVDQHGLFNYCAPANLAMMLKFWGWPGDRTDIGDWVKPFEADKNVMPYELQNYVAAQTGLTSVLRAGGDLGLLRQAVSRGYPVLIETGAMMRDMTGKVSWMGHYQVVIGYDDDQETIFVHDSFYEENRALKYESMVEDWWSFNNTFLLVYPAEQETSIQEILGERWQEEAAWNLVLQQTLNEDEHEDGLKRFFTLFNRGTSLVNLERYGEAANAYDEAFTLYPDLPPNRRPWRMLWYQTGPYFAYYYAGRYEDVIRLATQTINAASQPYLEESWYWRGMARYQSGDREGAIADLEQSLEYHPGFGPSLAGLNTVWGSN